MRCLPAIQRTVWEGRRLHIVYQMEFTAGFEEVVARYALLAKANSK